MCPHHHKQTVHYCTLMTCSEKNRNEFEYIFFFCYYRAKLDSARKLETYFDKCSYFAPFCEWTVCVTGTSNTDGTRGRRRVFDEARERWLYSDTLQETARPTMWAHFCSVCVSVWARARTLYFSGMQCSPAINLVSFNMWLLSLQPVIAANHNSDIRTDLLIYRGSGAQM